MHAIPSNAKDGLSRTIKPKTIFDGLWFRKTDMIRGSFFLKRSKSAKQVIAIKIEEYNKPQAAPPSRVEREISQPER